MSRWFRLYDEMLNNCSVQSLPGDVFRRKFLAAMHGEQNEFSEFVIPDPQCGRLSPKEWAVVRAKIFARDDYTCAYCGARGVHLECDHKHPVSKGGSNDAENLVTACRPCNRAKHVKTECQWKSFRMAAI